MSEIAINALRKPDLVKKTMELIRIMVDEEIQNLCTGIK